MKPPKLIFPTLTSIISWANGNVLKHDLQFLGQIPYIKANNNLFHYFKHVEHGYELVFTSERDLGSF